MKRYPLRVPLLLLILALMAFTCRAGGFLIQPDSVTFNGYACGASFLPGQEIHMHYTATDYSFSGGVDEFEYFVFKLENKRDHSFQYILQLTKDYISRSRQEDNFGFELLFLLPKVKGDYMISYYKAPMLSRVALGNKQESNMIWIDGEARGAIDRFVRSYGSASQPLCSLNVGGANATSEIITERDLRYRNAQAEKQSLNAVSDDVGLAAAMTSLNDEKYANNVIKTIYETDVGFVANKKGRHREQG